jgi:hypothetical protein
MKFSIILLSAFLLVGCAPALQSGEMMPKSKIFDQLGSSKFDNSIIANKIEAKAGAGGIAPITSDAYKEALIASLRQAGLYSKQGKEKYALDAYLKEVDQPIIGFNFTVKTTADYTITNVKSGKVAYKESLTLPCTVLFAEEFLAEVRLRRATACSVAENITHFLKTITN